MFFTEKNRKKNLIFLLVLPLFCGAVFLTQTHIVYAAWWNPADWVRSVLYGIFSAFGIFASLAVTVFEWAIDPKDVNLLFNSQGVYESWKFVRDFFNLFFILVLLYIAFLVIFQIEKNFKKTLLSLVLAALFINFSFPVSRALIDVTNVPMYFFANQMAARDPGAGTLFGATMTASKIENILLPQKDNTQEFSRFFMAIIFLFLFSVTLFVLSIMFVIRLVALVILVIFSSVGFAASIVPGLSSYSKMWWESFWKYAFFGPAAMLMLLVATRFFASLSNQELVSSMQTVAQTNVAGNEATFYSSMLMFSIPIIMLWFTMGVAQKFSIAGASSVVGMGQKFSKWAGSKASGLSAVKRNYAAYAAARKSRYDAKNKNNFGSRLGGGFNKKQDTIYGATGLPGSKAARQRVEDTKNKEIYEKAEANKKNGASNSELRLQLTSGDRVKAAAAAISLSERGAVNSANEFSAALKALGNNTKEVSALIEKAGSGAVGGLSGAEYGAVMNSDTLRSNPDMQKKFESKVKKEGGAKAIVEYNVSQMPVGAGGVAANQMAAVEAVLKSMKSSKDVAASESLFSDPTYGGHARAYVNDPTKTTTERKQAIKKASAEDGTTVGSHFP